MSQLICLLQEEYDILYITSQYFPDYPWPLLRLIVKYFKIPFIFVNARGQMFLHPFVTDVIRQYSVNKTVKVSSAVHIKPL